MELKTLKQKVKGLTDGGEDRGVSPVIGVILMVAITVILAAVIGAFVLNLGNDLDASQTPTASVNAEIIPGATETDPDDVRFTHNNGDSIDPANLRIVTDTRAELDTTAYTADSFGSGSTITVSDHTDISGYTGTVSLVYDDGESSNNLASIEVANA